MAIPLNQVVAAHRRQALRLNQQITDQELAKVLRDGARDASQMAGEIAALPRGVGAMTREAQLRIAAQSAQDISDKLWSQTENITRDGIFRATDMAVRQGIDVDRIVGMPTSFIQGYSEGLIASGRRTAETIIARRRFGYTLSERIYRNSQQTVGRVHRTIESGLVRNLSAREMAKEVRGLIDPSVPGGPSYSAMRLARTEINNSHHWAHREHMSNRPWIESVDWLLSGSHPEPDECDDIAQNGPYNKKEVPDKPHPQCLCYIAPNLPDSDEFIDSLANGDYNDWMEENSGGRIICNSSCSVEGPDGNRYQRWDTDEEREAWMEEHYGDEYLNQLSFDERDALDDYMSDSRPYNGVLRETFKVGDSPMEDWEIDRVNERLFSLLDLPDRAPIPENTMLFRGINEDAANLVTRANTFTDPGLVSTSLDFDIAEGFRRSGGSGYMMEIEAPAGTKAIGIGGEIADEGAFGNEWEMILAPGTTFEILQVDHIARKILARVI